VALAVQGGFTRSLQRLIPEIRAAQLRKAPAGVRAQALAVDGSLVDDFLIQRNERVVNVCNAPSPAATSSLAIGQTIVGTSDGVPAMTKAEPTRYPIERLSEFCNQGVRATAGCRPATPAAPPRCWPPPTCAASTRTASRACTPTTR